MMTRRQLRAIHVGDLPLHVLEQDYVQAIFLQELYSQTDTFVFKGGTYMKHAFGLDRFSEDLDFDLRQGKEAIGHLKWAASRLARYGIPSTLERLTEGDVSITAALRYQGPLYNGSVSSIGTVDIEVSKRDDIALEPEWTRLFFKYPESPVVNVLGLNKVEVLAEKIRALSSRTKGRDLYDVWFLLKNGVTPDRELFARKMSIMNREPVVDLSVSEKDFVNDLRILLSRPPGYLSVRDHVRTELLRNGFALRE